ncbi:uncharacterized protein [Lolium perenne]|uniref:uncharacterized protein n=1 Tax=Lolium perenne TaxID=4522 RepID=UPI003A992168
MEVYMGNLKHVDGETLKITTAYLVGTLEANALMLSTRKLHEDLRIHVLEQIKEIEGLREHAENSRKAIQLLETRLQEETAKHSSLDELSAKVKVLEAENESLQNFMKESSSKETEARKELSEKHAREKAELIDKLEKSQGRVISIIAKNKALEAEAEAIDKLIFPSLGFEWTKDSNLTRTEAYDEARISIDALFGACRGIATALSLKKAKTTVIDTMTKLMRQVAAWSMSLSEVVASRVLEGIRNSEHPHRKLHQSAKDEEPS